MPRRKKPSNRHQPNATGANIKWSVLWIKPKGDGDYRIIRKEFGNDLGAALDLYQRVVRAGKRLPTLRSNNVGFPPPERYRPYDARVRDKRWKKGKRQPGITKFKWVVRVPMRTLNRKGTWWCPYCREMRRFQQQGGFYIDGVIVPSEGYYCPLCGVSHRDIHVRRWNPLAQRIYMEQAK